MLLAWILGALTLVSLGLTLWQWAAARRFPLHERRPAPDPPPPLTLLKPLKGCDAETAACLRSWFEQDYSGPVQILFGVASPEDPVIPLVRGLIAEYPARTAELVLCAKSLGPNAKVSTLVQLERLARHEKIVVSDADVCVPPDFLAQIAAALQEPRVALVSCFYALANPANLAMRWEALVTNADFWSQVLQARQLKALDFALGAVMATTQTELRRIGGFASLVGYLADDFQLGRSMARNGAGLVLAPMVVECRSAPMTWREVWVHQVRWARTIRGCEPWAYFFSIVGNGTLWPLTLCVLGAWLWLTDRTAPDGVADTVLVCGLAALVLSLAIRISAALMLQEKLTRRTDHRAYWWLVPLSDLLRAVTWMLAFLGNTVTWRGERFSIQRGGKLVKVN